MRVPSVKPEAYPFMADNACLLFTSFQEGVLDVRIEVQASFDPKSAEGLLDLLKLNPSGFDYPLVSIGPSKDGKRILVRSQLRQVNADHKTLNALVERMLHAARFATKIAKERPAARAAHAPDGLAKNTQ